MPAGPIAWLAECCSLHCTVIPPPLQKLPPGASICESPIYAGHTRAEGLCEVNTVLDQCMTEQKYLRGAMMRSLLYTQVSISGQALVFVVRNQGYSLMERAGGLTYIAFFGAQIGATLFGLFGFGGYARPAEYVPDAWFTRYSTGGEILFFADKNVPIANTESDFTASVIGCT